MSFLIWVMLHNNLIEHGDINKNFYFVVETVGITLCVGSLLNNGNIYVHNKINFHVPDN